MGGVPRTVWKCNLPTFLIFIVFGYEFFTYSVFKGNLWISSAVSILTLVSLYSAALANPGCVPANYTLPQGTVESEDTVCKYCVRPRPPRAHHCRYCQQCVVRYDHHCDWIDNCVGARNHKCFILFIFYIDCAIFHYFSMLIIFFAESLGTDFANAGPWGVVATVMLVFYTIIVLPCSLFGVIFLFWATFLVLRNETSLENSYVRRKKISNDKGCFRNICEVFGRNPLLWLVPTLQPIVLEGSSASALTSFV